MLYCLLETLDRLKIMGTGSSAQPKIGVQSNPRIVYADQQAKKTKKASYTLGFFNSNLFFSFSL